MAADFSLRIYFPGPSGGWTYQDYGQLPVWLPCVVIFHPSDATALADARDLYDAVDSLLEEIEASRGTSGQADWHDLDPKEANFLHVVVCKGGQQTDLEPAVLKAADKADSVWIMPVVEQAHATRVSDLLSPGLAKRNVAFWISAIDELRLTVLARAGVTSLDRRVFISYRRTDTSPMADQLFDALTRRNFKVFLDRVSVEPGVDFQASLFEQLADKSMVVLLNSPDFPASRWTMEEIRFARQRRLSLLIVRLPGTQDGLGASAGEEWELVLDDLSEEKVPGFARAQSVLHEPALQHLVEEIVFRHDFELIGRLRNMRARVLEAAQIAGSDRAGGPTLTVLPSAQDCSVTVRLDEAGGGSRQYTIYPSAYPPDVPDLYNAAVSTRNGTGKRLVVGNTASMLPVRVLRLDWIVNQRNVGHYDIDAIALMFDRMKSGQL